MVTVVLIAIAIAILAGLVSVVRTDRPLTTPRSHTHELDPHAARLHRVP
jgi:hypothetical protein